MRKFEAICEHLKLYEKVGGYMRMVERLEFALWFHGQRMITKTNFHMGSDIFAF